MTHQRSTLSLFAAVLATILAGVGLAACSSSASTTSTGSTPPGTSTAASSSVETTTIRYESVPNPVNPLEVAAHLGYLPNIELDEVGTVLNGAQSLQNLATSQTDVGLAFNGNVVDLVAAGGEVTSVIGAFGTNEKQYFVIDTLAGNGISDGRDLIGKSIGVNGLKTPATAILTLWLAREGLTADEIKEVTFAVTPPANAYQALAEHKLDAIFLNKSAVDALPPGGPELKQLATDFDLVGPYTWGSFVLRDEFIEQQPEAAKELVAGIAKAEVWLAETPLPEVLPVLEAVAVEHNRADTVAVLQRWKSLGLATKGGSIEPVDFEPWLEASVADGTLQEGQLEASDLFTNEFNPEAP